MDQLPDVLESGEPARLLPVVKDSQLEDRATSILLATVLSVPGFAKALLDGIGPQIGRRATLSAYSQVVLRNRPDESKLRPDGLIEIATGSRRWRALVEGKVLRAEHNEEQIRGYLKIAKLNGLDALITISNQFASLPTHHPVKMTRPPPRGVSLFHWSWMSVVTTATLLLLEDDFESAEQKFLLSEFVRYFEHPASGVQGFDRMNAEWKDVVTKVQTGAGLSRNSDEIIDTVGSWHQETRDLCLILTRALGARVRLGLSRTHAKDAGTRLRDDCATLVDTHKLTVTLDVRDAASPITIVADLRRRAITCSMRLEAPTDKKRAVARTNWLLRQLKNIEPGGIVIDAIWPRRSRRTQAPLAGLRADPRQLEAGMSGLTPIAFEVLMVRDLAGRFSGRKTFVEALESVVPEFYGRVGQRLRAWVPPPPRLEPRKPDAESVSVQQTADVMAAGKPPLAVICLPPPRELPEGLDD